VWLDTTGREVVVRRPIEFDESGWPHTPNQRLEVAKDQASAGLPCCMPRVDFLQSDAM
jgi:hypothetical protein